MKHSGILDDEVISGNTTSPRPLWVRVVAVLLSLFCLMLYYLLFKEGLMVTDLLSPSTFDYWHTFSKVFSTGAMTVAATGFWWYHRLGLWAVLVLLSNFVLGLAFMLLKSLLSLVLSLSAGVTTVGTTDLIFTVVCLMIFGGMAYALCRQPQLTVFRTSWSEVRWAVGLGLALGIITEIIRIVCDYPY